MESEKPDTTLKVSPAVKKLETVIIDSSNISATNEIDKFSSFTIHVSDKDIVPFNEANNTTTTSKDSPD